MDIINKKYQEIGSLVFSDNIITDVTLNNFQMTGEYTAFEVFPTTEDIPAGTVDETTGIEYYNEISPWSLFGLELKTKHLQKDSNIIIDWGDGNKTDVKNTISDNESPTSTIDKDSMYYPSGYDSEENEIKIEFTHKYKTQGKYTVKIYGNTYWGVRAKYDKGFSNLINRIFEKDLPMASCIVNVSSLCRNSLRLQKIEIANYTLFPNIINISSIFQNCTNLHTAKGFSVYGSTNKYNCFNGIMYGCYSVFSGCTNLRFSDYTIPIINTNTGTTVRTTYYNCSNLSVDVLTLLPQAGFCNHIIDIYHVFRNCNLITCSDYEALGKILWNDTSINWTNINKCFTGCTSLDLSKIPFSWGGTNKEIDIQLQLKKLNVDTTDYTAFEVYANSETIPVGDTTLGTEVFNTDKYIVKQEIPTGMEHHQIIRFSGNLDDNNIIIDWGDGEVVHYNTTDKNYNHLYNSTISVSHRYSNSGKYLVKIYGNYWGLKSPTTNDYKNADTKYAATDTNYNLMCSVFSNIHRVSLSVDNLSDFCRNASRLLYVNCSCNLISNYNYYAMFRNCQNLLYAYSILSLPGRLYGYLFRDCVNLIDTDFTLPNNPQARLNDGSIGMVFCNCNSLESYVDDLIPVAGFICNRANIYRLFYGCRKLKIKKINYVNKYLINSDVEYINASDIDIRSEVFAGCSDELRAQIPVSWGGTKA